MNRASAVPDDRHPAAVPWNADWRRLVASPQAGRALRRWRSQPLLDHPDLAAVLVAVGGGGDVPEAAGDAALGALVALAPTDRVAARVVVQRVLPGLINVARRRAGGEYRATAVALDDLTSAAWSLIVTYPLDRRPAKYAANIVRDAEYHCFVRPLRLRRLDRYLPGDDVVVRVASSSRLDGRHPHDEPNASELVAALLDRGERRGLPADDVDLLRLLFVEHRRVEAIAAERAITGRAVRYQREAAIERLARLAAA